ALEVGVVPPGAAGLPAVRGQAFRQGRPPRGTDDLAAVLPALRPLRVATADEHAVLVHRLDLPALSAELVETLLVDEDVGGPLPGAGGGGGRRVPGGLVVGAQPAGEVGRRSELLLRIRSALTQVGRKVVDGGGD